MSLLDAPHPPAGGSSRPVAAPREVLRRARVPLALLAVVALVGFALAFATGTSSAESLDPTSPAQGGSLALARLLGARGAQVTRVPQVPGEPGTSTMFVPDSARLPARAVARLLDLAADTDVVVVVDDADSADALGLGGGGTGGDADAVHDPGCGLDYATAAGGARTGGSTYALRVGPRGFRVTDRCYTVLGEPSLVRLLPLAGTGSLTLVGTAAWARNDRLAQDGNAALGLGLLTRAGRDVRWVLPLPGESAGAAGDRTGLLDLLPRRLLLAVGQLGVALLLLAGWRARRLGPVVTEQLPVVVRAVETVRGQARLYRGAGARDRAALALREAARARLAGTLGLGPHSRPEALVHAVAATAGRHREEVADLLYSDRAPADDPGLVRLAGDLDTLTEEVRRP